MNRNKQYNKKSYQRRKNSKDANKAVEKAKKDIELRHDDDNDPYYYFTDKQMAEQVTQLAFRYFSGKNISLMNNRSAVSKMSNVMTVLVNPSPGVQDNLLASGRKSGINMAAYKFFSVMAAFVGRTMQYAPQDVAVMMLQMGELISCIEFVRRAFGVAYVYSLRSRSYPIDIIEAMNIDSADLMENYALHRNRFNKLVTMVSQIPIPKNVAYFNKCASLYEKVYTDSPSPMAQSVILVPATTWILNESAYEQGTILETVDWACQKTGGLKPGKSGHTHRTMDEYLDTIEEMIVKLLNSSTYNIIYADMLNYFNKVGGEVWKFDYLIDGYQVMPEYSETFLNQFHNMVATWFPTSPILYTGEPERLITPYNDVYPDNNNNMLVYNPGLTAGFATWYPEKFLVDFNSGEPDLNQRVDALRFMPAISHIVTEIEGVTYLVNNQLPDHYIVSYILWDNGDQYGDVINPIAMFSNSVSPNDFANICNLSRFHACPILYGHAADSDAYNGTLFCEVDYYTTVDPEYLRDIMEFIALDLYTYRAKPVGSE